MQLDGPGPMLLAELEALWALQGSRAKWAAVARPEQITPPGDWSTWLILAGRGWGKTRTGAEDVAAYGLANRARRIAVVAPTIADARDTCVEGESGLLSVIDGAQVQAWNRSLGELILANGSRFKLFSAEEPERLRGPQHHRAWCDELGAWPKAQATWDQLQFGLRLGDRPRAVVTTTPKPTPLIRKLVSAEGVIITRGSTYDNAANVAPSFLAQIRAAYEGTRLGRQEINAELLDDTPGALWTRAMLEAAYVEIMPAMRRIVIAVDPSGSNGQTGDRQGIIVAGLGVDGRGYLIADATMRGSPEQWAARVASLYREHRADRVVAERNFGGAMVEAVLRAAAPNLPITMVTASRGKSVRAEPVAALYEQGRIGHVGSFPELEDQMVQMTTHGFTGEGSPDNLDAAVWAFTDLMVDANPWAGYFEYARAETARLRGKRPGDRAEPQGPQYAVGSMEWATQQEGTVH